MENETTPNKVLRQILEIVADRKGHRKCEFEKQIDAAKGTVYKYLDEAEYKRGYVETRKEGHIILYWITEKGVRSLSGFQVEKTFGPVVKAASKIAENSPEDLAKIMKMIEELRRKTEAILEMEKHHQSSFALG